MMMQNKFSLTCFKRRFTPGWGLSFCALLAVALCMRLGFWQLARHSEKQQMLEAATRQHQQDFTRWHPGTALPVQYQKIKLKGHFSPSIFFLDNQHHNHQLGYHVLTPLQIEGADRLVLVDRGWVAAQHGRRTLPEIKTSDAPREIKGMAYYPGKGAFLLGENIELRGQNRMIIERVEIKKIAEILQKKVVPFIIRLDPKQPDGFTRQWALVSMPPERHKAYAAQWFGIASVIFIIFIALSFKKTL